MSTHAVRAVVALTLLSLGASGCAHSAQRASRPRVEVVEVGYGSQPRSTVTGAIASANREQIGSHHTMSVADLLDGIPGVRVVRGGHSFSVRVRGATADPLFVVDGKPMSAASGYVLATLRPSDIELIDVLKDAGAVATYGMRGANGVVLITTKRAP